MARPTNDARLQKIFEDARTEFDEVQGVVRDVRMECLQDRRFYSVTGAQWEGPLGEQFENRPKLEFNAVHLSVIRIINEYRNNRIDVDFVPKDGTTESELADTCDGLYRADEQDSGAQEAHDNAFEEGVGGGFGAARVRACYEDDEDEDNDKQRLRIEPIFDADSSVFFDLDAKRQDKSDARKCWVLTSMSYNSFEEQFGHSPSTWPKSITQVQFDWCTPTVVYVAEYYVKEESTELAHFFRGLVEDEPDMKVLDSELKADPTKLDTLLATGFREVRQKRVKRIRVHKYLMSGQGIEEDCGYIAGKCIPVVPFYGKRWFVDNVERCMGHVRLAKDAQRLQNSLLSWLTEIASRFDMEKPIVSPEQMLGWSHMWARDNIDRFPFLYLNTTKDANGDVIPGSQAPVAYTKAPNIPPAMAALVQIAQQALQDLLGNQEAGEQMQPNLSGKAVELIQNRLDMQVFIYMSNFAKYVKRIGEVWLSMAKDIYIDDERKMKTISNDGEVSSVTMREPGFDAKTGREQLLNDLTKATFDVWPDVGPSSSSRRAATVRALTGMASVSDDPQTKQVLQAAAMMNIEGEGLGDVRDFFRKKLVQMGVVKPTDEEREEMAAEQQQAAQQPPDANTQYLLSAAKEADTGATLNKAKIIDTLAHANFNEAQAHKASAEAGSVRNSDDIATVQAMQEILAAPPVGAPQPAQ